MGSNFHIAFSKMILKQYSFCQNSYALSVRSHYFKRTNCLRRFSTLKSDTTHPLTKEKADELVRNLSPEEREYLLESIHHVTSDETKADYKDQLAAYRWRSEFGRPSRLAQLGDVDPTGSYCPLPEDWLLQKYTETVPQPTRSDIIRVAIFNAIPFIGFGFLDNFFMITFGDTIEAALSGFIVITTMTAAALGNTISDILGIGSAWYVEQAVSKLGFQPPKLLPVQMDMKITRRAANMGRTIGVTIGCILGMSPLLFLKPKQEIEEPAAEFTD
ncbi:unnamed protein product [Bemisia tabaci]|uniref:Transmembrane protein 65 n=1 Tax=Bemisia tabaci TaxID=7038 RepID=A0A9P0AKA9_BEMTA|nr:unnamed protein product [Bemisia tabaci]